MSYLSGLSKAQSSIFQRMWNSGKNRWRGFLRFNTAEYEVKARENWVRGGALVAAAAAAAAAN